MATIGKVLIGFEESQSRALTWRVCLSRVAAFQTPATVQAALMSYGKILSLRISF